jgi:hypothetical protein
MLFVLEKIFRQPTKLPNSQEESQYVLQSSLQQTLEVGVRTLIITMQIYHRSGITIDNKDLRTDCMFRASCHFSR